MATPDRSRAADKRKNGGRDDPIHAGANWVDEEDFVDGKLITSRKPDDLPALMRAVISEL